MQPSEMIREAKKAKTGFHWGIELLIFIAVFLVSQILASIPIFIMETSVTVSVMREKGSVTVATILENQPTWATPLQLFSTGIAAVTVLLFCKILQKRNARSMGFGKRHALMEYLAGTLIGILMISASFLICYAGKSVTAAQTGFSATLFVLCLFGFLIQGASEEILCRGYFMVSVARKNALFWAIFLNSILFSLLHLLNPGFSLLACLNIFLFGLFESFFVLWRGNLWGACAIHSFWNFFQGNVFGISVSGTDTVASPLLTENAPEKSAQLWNGGQFGLEGGLAVTIVLTVATVTVVLLWLRKRNRMQSAPEPEKETAQPAVYDPFR